MSMAVLMEGREGSTACDPSGAMVPPEVAGSYYTPTNEFLLSVGLIGHLE